ncbi:MAG TPA: hypothetical protein VNN07_17205 [Candidatus Tectomicrobia bacterium]|nr:hypothetical protein [Candidatus Tectomicrobia bacterium]
MSALLLSLTACATTSSSRAVRTEFEDIPVPRGMSFVEDRSTVIESPTVKAARLVYRGPIELSSLVTAMRSTVEANGWRHVSSTKGRDTVQVFEKGGSSLEVRYWEGFWFRPVTYVEVTTSRALGGAANPASTAQPYSPQR